MPNASGRITMPELHRMREIIASGGSAYAAAKVIGCSPKTVLRLTRDVRPSRPPMSMSDMKQRADALRYARFVARASAYVPTIGARPF